MSHSASSAERFDYVQVADCVCGMALKDSSEVITKQFSWGEVSFRHCPGCASMIQSPRVSTAAISRWYDSESYRNSTGQDQGPYLDYLGQEAQRAIEARTRYQRDLHPHLQSDARVLEVGCATGSLLAAIAAAGHQVAGIELSETFAKQAMKLNGISVSVGDFSQYEKDAGQWDAIIMMGTISNLPDLNQQLLHVHHLLKPKGLFYFNLPVVTSLAARLYKDRYWMYAPSVCNFMSAHGLEQALNLAGFDLVERRRDRQQPTLAKLLGHLRAHRIFEALAKAGGAKWQLPFAIPIPGVEIIWARAR